MVLRMSQEHNTGELRTLGVLLGEKMDISDY